MKQFAKPLLLLLFILTLGMKPSRSTSAVGGDCLYNCEGSTCYDFSNKSQFCGDLRAKCLARCSGKKLWGAIAYSPPDEQFGFAYEFDTLPDAKKRAMDQCQKTGKACKLWVYYENQCGAVAADGNIVTWGTDFLKEKAQQGALAECRKGGGKNCKIEVWSCSKM